MGIALRYSARDRESTATVRRELTADLTARFVAPCSIDDIVLVASELVGNAVRHAEDPGGDGGFAVEWQDEGRTVLVRVLDSSRTEPVRRQAERTASNGRGLAIVAALASDWGIEPREDGKAVWARIPVQRADTLTAAAD